MTEKGAIMSAKKSSVLPCPYETARTLLEATTLLSNIDAQNVVEDSSALIALICRAYDLEEKVCADLTEKIIFSLSPISTAIDCELFLSKNMSLPGEDNATQFLAQIKSDVMLAFHNLYKAYAKVSRYTCLDYSYLRRYDASMRYAELLNNSYYGNVPLIRQLGMMLQAGIGCEASAENAARRYMQCAMWGDIASMRLLSKLDLPNKRELPSLMSEVAALCEKYLPEGMTELPEEKAAACSRKAIELFNCISSIRYDLVGAQGLVDINLSFVEALLHTDSYSERMEFINSYEQNAWRAETNSSPSSRTGRMGF